MIMKRLIPFVSAAMFMVACNQKPADVATTTTAPYIQQQAPQQSVADTAGLARFNAWKAQNELSEMQSYTAKAPAAAAPSVRKSAPVRKPSSASSAPVSTPAPTAPVYEEGAGSGSSAGTAGTGESTETAQTNKKEGWSKAAKGAVIGGVAGAAGGAVINKKNRVVGAVVGAVIGAGGGYVLGRTQDKKDGRIDYTPIK